jgi:rubrerythrin
MPAARKRTVSEHALEASHPGHAQHLCELVANRKMDMVADLSQGAKYICNICGRAAANAVNLCEPVEI